MTTQQVTESAAAEEIDEAELAAEARAAAETEGVRRIVVGATEESPNEEHARRLLRAFEQWRDAVAARTAESKKLSDKIKGKLALFNEAMNVGHSNESDQILKLGVVEARYQEWQEAIAEKKTTCGLLGDQVKAARTKLDELIEEAKSPQMNLFSSRPSDDEGNDAGDTSSPE
jgi:hypothetical protein